MVSNYKRKTERGSYSKEKLKEAAEAVRNGSLSGYKASQLFNIPRMTIMDCVNQRRNKSNTLGRNTALGTEAETMLANGLKLMEKHGFGLSRKELLETVGEYVQKNKISTNFKNGIPGQAWFAGFKNRHNLSIKKPQAVEYARKKAIDPFIVYPYFDLLKNTLEELNLRDKPEAIWNMDETSFSKDPEKTKTVGAKGHAATRVIASPGRDNTTVLLCGNARGEKAPPMIIYKGKNVWDSWVSPDAYPNTSYAATDNGWMESEIFEQYFIKTFLPTIGNQRPILLIYDGHATHVGLNIIMKAREAGVTILKLPAHTSHVLQPLDVAVMKSFKDKWDSLLVKEQRLNVGVPIPKAKFAQLIGEVWKEIDGQVLKSGFRKTGIFPYNVDEIAEKNFDSLKLQRWRQHLATTASGNSVTVATKNSETIVAKTPKSLLVLALDIATEALPEKPTPKIKILENKIVSFEDLLLLKVKAGNNETVKRRKMAPGAEVITNEDVLKRKIELQSKVIKKENREKKMNEKNKEKKNCDSENENGEKKTNEKNMKKKKSDSQKKNGKKTINEKNMKEKNCDNEKENRQKKINEPKLKKKKRSKVITPDTSVSDCFSVYSDSDDCEDNFVLNMVESKTIKETEIEKKSNKICNSSDRENKVGMEDSDTMNEMENPEDENYFAINSDKVSKVAMEGSIIPEKGNEMENPQDENTLAINDHVLVRYYSRKKWTYYVGYVEEIKAAEEVRYTIRFYKTVKNPLKFVLTKKIDCDDVPLESVLKKVHLMQAPNNPKEFVLSDNVDTIYFT